MSVVVYLANNLFCISDVCHMQLVLSCKPLPAVQSPALCRCIYQSHAASHDTDCFSPDAHLQQAFLWHSHCTKLHSCSERSSVVAYADEGSAVAADIAEAETRPIRHSSAIHFNAALGGWGNAPAVPARPLSARHMPAAPTVPAAVKTVQNAVVQPLATVSTAMTSQRAGQMGTVPVSSNQQELRPRSSDGILQRITVDRGPATGVIIQQSMQICLGYVN